MGRPLHRSEAAQTELVGADPCVRPDRTHMSPRILIAVLAGSVSLGAQTRPQPGVKLPMTQIDAQMFHVSAGKRLKPAHWPNGARVAVGLSFDVDNATASLA